MRNRQSILSVALAVLFAALGMVLGTVASRAPGACDYQWVWMKGNVNFEVGAVYRTQGIPAVDNTPGARYESVSWIDSSGALRLFGGNGTDGAGNSVRLNDLWNYDPAASQWTWIKGDNTEPVSKCSKTSDFCCSRSEKPYKPVEDLF